VWINNAGRELRDHTRPFEQDVDDMMTVNVKSALYGMQVAAAHFIERGTAT